MTFIRRKAPLVMDLIRLDIWTKGLPRLNALVNKILDNYLRLLNKFKLWR